MNTNTALRCVDLSVGYRKKGAADRVVVSGLNLDLQQGEFVCMLGPNGAGKSTLMRALAGLEKPLRGRVEIGSEQIDDLAPKERARRISVVLTEPLPLGMFDAEAIVALGRHPHTNWTGRLTPRDRARIAWSLQAVGAQDLAHRSVSELSDGERQKVMVARALAQETGIMFLDEPTAYLDLPRRVELMQTLRDLARNEGLSIVLSSHDLDLALRCADRLWLLSEEGSMTTGMPEALALEGAIARAFASAKLDWDAEHGSFRMHRAARAPVWIEGSGAARAWTQRALMRIGYGLSENPSEALLAVRIDDSATGRNWVVEAKGYTYQCASIEMLVNRLKRDASHREERNR